MSAWRDLAKACERVIAEQSFAALEPFERAPAFTTGKIGTKELAVYDASRELMAVARVVRDQSWEQCLVREVEEDERRARALAADWVASLAEDYPKPEYLGLNHLTPDYADPGVIRCEAGAYVLTIQGYFGLEFVNRYNHDVRSHAVNGNMFRVFVAGQTSNKLDDFCREVNDA